MGFSGFWGKIGDLSKILFYERIPLIFGSNFGSFWAFWIGRILACFYVILCWYGTFWSYSGFSGILSIFANFLHFLDFMRKIGYNSPWYCLKYFIFCCFLLFFSLFLDFYRNSWFYSFLTVFGDFRDVLVTSLILGATMACY